MHPRRTFNVFSWPSRPASAFSSRVRPLPGVPSRRVSRPGFSTPLAPSMIFHGRMSFLGPKGFSFCLQHSTQARGVIE